MDFKEIKEKYIEEFKDVRSFQDLKTVDRKLLMPIAALFAFFLIGYFIFVFYVYSSNSEGDKLRAQQRESAKNYVMSKEEKIRQNNSGSLSDFGNIGPDTQDGLEIKEILNGFFYCITSKQFDKGYSFLNPNMIAASNLTVEQFGNYFGVAYPPIIDYKVDYIWKNNNIYQVRLLFNNTTPNSNIYYPLYDEGVNYFFEKVNGVWKIAIPSIFSNNLPTGR